MLKAVVALATEPDFETMSTFGARGFRLHLCSTCLQNHTNMGNLDTFSKVAYRGEWEQGALGAPIEILRRRYLLKPQPNVVLGINGKG